MKRTLLLLVLTCASLTAQARSSDDASIAVCSGVGNIAEKVMIHRQTVNSKPRTIEMMRQQFAASGQQNNVDLASVAARIIDTAYTVDHEPDREHAANAVLVFKLTWTSMCIQAGRK